MQKNNNLLNKNKIENPIDNSDSIKELVEGFSKEKYNLEKTKEEKKIFKKQIITLIIVIFITIGTIIGASFAIYYAYKNEQNETNIILITSIKKDKDSN